MAAEVAIKPYPICHFLHACVDAARALKSKYDLEASDIRHIRVLLHPETFHSVCDNPDLRRRPSSEYVAKFSAHYTVAAALVRGACGYAELERAVIEDPRILALAQKVEHAPDPQSQFPRYFSGGVEIVLNDGRMISHHEPINRGAGERRLTREEIVRKFMENAEFAVPRPRAEEMLEVLLHVERFDAQRIAQSVSEER
jgi:2-methylcitrate dehydratase PrpD